MKILNMPHLSEMSQQGPGSVPWKGSLLHRDTHRHAELAHPQPTLSLPPLISRGLHRVNTITNYTRTTHTSNTTNTRTVVGQM